MTDGVKMFLQNIGMLKYYPIFSAKGFDLETDIPFLNQSDLKETLMVACEKERDTILRNARKFVVSSEHHLYEWLRRHSMEHYFINFQQSGYLDLKSVSNIQLPDENLYDELEIVVPCHKKRMERAVHNLRQEMQRRAVAEKPVAHGWWGKPQCLPQAKFDFLCVEGTLFAQREPDKRVKIDFMVDSGSDVSTIQEETLESLNLELVGPIYSAGIHGGNHTNLYRAQLQIGIEVLAIEVIASNYDSLGSRIIRHFRHVVDGNRHIWLKGNYIDPLPAIFPLKAPTRQVDEKIVQSIELKPTTQTPANHIISHEKTTTKFMAHSSPSLPPASSSRLSINQSSNVEFCNKDNPHSLLSSSTLNGEMNITSMSDVKSCIHTNSQISSLHSQNFNTTVNVRTKRLANSDDSQSCEDSNLSKRNRLDDIIVGTLVKEDTNNQFNGGVSEKLNDSSSVLTHNTSCEPTKAFPSVLRDTDDDIDHMDSELFLKRALFNSPLENHNNNHIHSSTALQQPTFFTQHDFEYLDQNGSGYASSHETENIFHKGGTVDVIHISKENIEEPLMEVVHVNSDEDEDEENYGQKKKIHGEFGGNFMPGSSASSVTISMLDLIEGDSDIYKK